MSDLISRINDITKDANNSDDVKIKELIGFYFKNTVYLSPDMIGLILFNIERIVNARVIKNPDPGVPLNAGVNVVQLVPKHPDRRSNRGREI